MFVCSEEKANRSKHNLEFLSKLIITLLIVTKLTQLKFCKIYRFKIQIHYLPFEHILTVGIFACGNFCDFTIFAITCEKIRAAKKFDV